MTPEELKALLLSGEEEGADRAAIYDQAVEAFAKIHGDYAATAGKIEELTSRVGKLTDTNYKLLEKIRYTEDEPAQQSSDEPIEMTIEQLFEMEG